MKTRNFVLKTMNFVLKTRNFVIKTRNFVFKMMNFAGAAAHEGRAMLLSHCHFSIKSIIFSTKPIMLGSFSETEFRSILTQPKGTEPKGRRPRPPPTSTGWPFARHGSGWRACAARPGGGSCCSGWSACTTSRRTSWLQSTRWRKIIGR